MWVSISWWNKKENQYSTNKKASNVTGHPLEQLNTQWNATATLTGYTPKLSLSVKNRYYDTKVRESFEIDMAVVKYGQDKVLNRDNGNFVRTNTWKPLFKKMKTIHWNLTSFSIKWRFSIVLSSVWKRLQPVWSKYHAFNNKTFVVLLADFDV